MKRELAHPYPRQTRVRKINSHAKDQHRDGDTGTIIDTAGYIGQYYGYWVKWDNLSYSTFVLSLKLEPA